MNRRLAVALGLAMLMTAEVLSAGGTLAQPLPQTDELPKEATETAANAPLPGALVAHWQPWQAYREHPLVADVRSQGLVRLEDRERMLRDELPADRALAAIDAVGPAALRRHAVERFLLIGITGRLTVGPSGSLRVENVRTAEASARHALLLGWARALVYAGEPARLLATSDRLQHAGAVQLLDLAAKKAPGWQVAVVAAALARAEAEQQLGPCHLAKNLDKAMRFSGKEALRLDAAERVQSLVRGLVSGANARCGPELTARVLAPIQLPPAKPDAPANTGRAPRSDGHLFGEAFAAAAPIFPGWLDQPLVKRLALRTPLDDVALAELIRQDKTGDAVVAALNASLHNRRIGVLANADVAWWAVLRSLGLSDADRDQQGRVKLSDLSAVQALALGYGYAIGNRNTELSRGPGLARDTPPKELLEYARSRLPMDALLGPLMAQAHAVDLERRSDPCKAARRAEALRAAIGHGALPAPAKQAMSDTLQSVEKACTAPAAPQP